MKKIEVLGTGCVKCNKLFDLTKKAADELKIEHELVKISDIQEIVARGVMMVPGLIVDGEVKSVGKVPSINDIKKMLEA